MIASRTSAGVVPSISGSISDPFEVERANWCSIAEARGAGGTVRGIASRTRERSSERPERDDSARSLRARRRSLGVGGPARRGRRVDRRRAPRPLPLLDPDPRAVVRRRDGAAARRRARGALVTLTLKLLSAPPSERLPYPALPRVVVDAAIRGLSLAWAELAREVPRATLAVSHEDEITYELVQRLQRLRRNGADAFDARTFAAVIKSPARGLRDLVGAGPRPHAAVTPQRLGVVDEGLVVAFARQRRAVAHDEEVPARARDRHVHPA